MEVKQKLEKFYDVATGVLALFAVSLAIIDIDRGLNEWQQTADNAVLAIFAVDYVARLCIAKNKKVFFKENIFDLVAIFPFSSFFRAFRVVRLVKLAKLVKLSKMSRLVSYSLRLSKRVRSFLDTNGFKYVLALSCGLVAVGGVAIHFAEGMELSDGFWWAFVTTTTVGYGDISPSTAPGRAIAIILMITGIGLIGSLTSTITSFFLNLKPEKPEQKDEIVLAVLAQLEDFEKLSNEDIDRICEILQTYKKK